jgi:hypothetical protein
MSVRSSRAAGALRPACRAAAGADSVTLMRPTLLAGLAVVLLLAAPASAETAGRTCPGSVRVDALATRIVILRGTTCRQARRVLRLYDRGTRPGTWRCALTHAPFDHIDSRIVGLACGRGGSAGDVRKRPQAFVGTIRPDGGGVQTRAPSTASSRPGKRASTSSARSDT